MQIGAWEIAEVWIRMDHANNSFLILYYNLEWRNQSSFSIHTGVGGRIGCRSPLYPSLALKLLIFLPLPPKCSDTGVHKRLGLCSAEDQTQGFVMQGEHSTSWAASLACAKVLIETGIWRCAYVNLSTAFHDKSF